MTSTNLGIDLTGFMSEKIADVIRNLGLSQTDVMGGWQVGFSLTADELVDS